MERRYYIDRCEDVTMCLQTSRAGPIIRGIRWNGSRVAPSYVDRHVLCLLSGWEGLYTRVVGMQSKSIKLQSCKVSESKEEVGVITML